MISGAHPRRVPVSSGSSLPERDAGAVASVRAGEGPADVTASRSPRSYSLTHLGWLLSLLPGYEVKGWAVIVDG